MSLDHHPIRVLVVDEQWLVRYGLLRLFEPERRIVVVANVATVADAMIAAREHEPEVVLLAAELPDADMLETCRALVAQHPALRVLVMSMSDDGDIVAESVLAGASGFLLKGSPPESFVSAMQAVAEGGSVIDPAVADTVLHWMRTAVSSDGTRLSGQQRRILRLIGQGLTNRQIAEQMSLSEHTIKTYVSGLFKKLGMHRRSEAAAYIARHQQALA